MNAPFVLRLLLFPLWLCCLCNQAPAAHSGLEIVLPRAEPGPISAGRLLLITVPEPPATSERDDVFVEPRWRLTAGADAVPFFGRDIRDWRPGRSEMVGIGMAGFPYRSLADLPPGIYRVQALLHRYTPHQLPDGRKLELPAEITTAHPWRDQPGNLFSAPQRLQWDGQQWRQDGRPPRLLLDRRTPRQAVFKETPWVKEVRIRSERLSAFWGRDIHLGALVILPAEFARRPKARYPLVIRMGGWPESPTHWRENEPDPSEPARRSDRFGLEAYNHIEAQHAFDLHRAWRGPDMPRMLLVELRHPTPFFEHSYAVDSANYGPYAEAIRHELIPEIERRFRGLGTAWSRFLFGGSAGGWMALSMQLAYPDDFNGAWAACPDPVHFAHFGTVDLYTESNLWQRNRHKRTPRPAQRDARGDTETTLEEQTRFEAVLGTRSRSGEQWSAWEAAFSPIGADGYPRRLFDRDTGVLDAETIAHWRRHFDLTERLRRDWASLAPRLRGKLRVHVGDRDDYFLELAVHSLERFLRSADPAADAVIEYGAGAGHCWNGDPTRDNAYSRLRYPQMVLPWALERIRQTAPAQADLQSWRY